MYILEILNVVSDFVTYNYLFSTLLNIFKFYKLQNLEIHFRFYNSK